MWTAKEIWEAGRAALAARGAAPTPPAPPVTAPATPAMFDPTAFTFHSRPYRVTFKNGIAVEYDGVILAGGLPFNTSEVERIEPVEEVGQGA